MNIHFPSSTHTYTYPTHAQTHILTVTQNSPAPSVVVIVVSIISTNVTPATNVQFQAAVPKVYNHIILKATLKWHLVLVGKKSSAWAAVVTCSLPQVMRVKLQPPTSMELGAFNPISPPPSISQIMLLANPTKVHAECGCRVANHLLLTATSNIYMYKFQMSVTSDLIHKAVVCIDSWPTCCTTKTYSNTSKRKWEEIARNENLLLVN